MPFKKGNIPRTKGKKFTNLEILSRNINFNNIDKICDRIKKFQEKIPYEQRIRDIFYNILVKRADYLATNIGNELNLQK